MFGNGSEDVECEPGGMRVIAGDELYACIHHGGDEGYVAREPVQFRNDKPGLVLPTGCQGFLQFRPIIAPARLDLGVLGYEDAADAREVAPHCGTLGLKAEARPALPISAHPVIGDESCGFGLDLGFLSQAYVRLLVTRGQLCQCQSVVVL